MGFFESFPPPPPPPQHRPRPAWVGPADLAFGGFVPLRLVLVHTASAVLVVDRLLAYPTGLEFTTVVAHSPATDADSFSFSPLHWDHRRRDTMKPPPEILRLGIVFSDGRKASNLLDPHPSYEQPPKHAVLTTLSGQGRRAHWEQRWWLWPLPPSGPLGFVVEWPAEGVEETYFELDGDVIRSAADEALMLGER